MNHLAILSMALLLSMPGPVAAQAATTSRIPVFVSHNGQDAVGAQLAAGVREALAGSPVLSEGKQLEDTDVVLLMSTLDPEPAKPGLATTVGWTLLITKETAKEYVGGGILLADRSRLPKASAEIVGRVQQIVDARKAEIASSPEARRREEEWDGVVQRASETLPEDLCGVKARTAFSEQLQTYRRWALAANVKLDVNDVVKSVLANFVGEDEFSKKIQAQAARLSQCQAELTALKRACTVKK